MGSEMCIRDRFRSYLSLQDVSRNAARIAAVERNDANADLAILQTVQNRLDTLNGDLVRVIIFQADTLASEFGDLPMQCTDPDNPTSADNECTVYSAAAVETALANGAPLTNGFRPDTLSGGVLKPGQRISGTNVGVYIEYEYQYVTGFFDTRTLTATTVQVVELDL